MHHACQFYKTDLTTVIVTLGEFVERFLFPALLFHEFLFLQFFNDLVYYLCVDAARIPDLALLFYFPLAQPDHVHLPFYGCIELLHEAVELLQFKRGKYTDIVFLPLLILKLVVLQLRLPSLFEFKYALALGNLLQSLLLLFIGMLNDWPQAPGPGHLLSSLRSVQLLIDQRVNHLWLIFITGAVQHRSQLGTTGVKAHRLIHVLGDEVDHLRMHANSAIDV